MRPLLNIASLVLILSGLSTVRGTPPSPQTHPEQSTWRYAYYLFLVGPPSGCEDCYVPLLITAEALENSGKSTTKASCVLVTTYERDSVWNNEGLFEISPGDVEVPPRIIHFRGRKYRYQQISSGEAVRLLESPLGTIPISRPLLKPLGSPGPTLGALIHDLRQAK